MLTNIFIKLVNKYANDSALANDLWLELFTKYADSSRHYHNLSHLEFMYENLKDLKKNIEDWETTIFSLFYHDSIYKASSNTNEEDSAKYASTKLTCIGYPKERIEKCISMILATKEHQTNQDLDTNYFIDADLAILGVHPEKYQQYADAIRLEYTMYPDFLYNSGRRKVLQQFIANENIYKTDFFRNKYEKQAIANLTNELETINT